MKKSKGIKVVLFLLVVILISMISFGGVYYQKYNKMVDGVKSYKLGMDFSNRISTELKVDETTNEVIYDSEGNIVKEKEEGITYDEANGYKVEQKPINSSEVLNKENYNKTVKILKDRLSKFGVEEYILELDKETGNIKFEMQDNKTNEDVIQKVFKQGVFQIIDEKTEEVLIDNSDVKSATVLYNSQEDGTTVYLSIKFDKEGQAKLEEISKEYIQVIVEKEENETEETEEEAETVTKNVVLKLDDEIILATYFGETISTGELTISVGNATTDNEQLQKDIKTATDMAVMIDIGKLPIIYNLGEQQTLSPVIDQNIIKIVVCVLIVIALVLSIISIIKFKLNGIIAILSEVLFTALLLLLIRYTNIIITIPSLVAIVISVIINYVTIFVLLNLIKKEKALLNKSIIKILVSLLPILIVSIVLCFIKWTAISSFGMVIFWGIVAGIILDIIIAKYLMK